MLKFDIIHVHHPMLLGNIAQYLGKKYNITVVYTYHTRYEFNQCSTLQRISITSLSGKHL